MKEEKAAEILNTPRGYRDDKYELKDYKCRWCQHKFRMYVGKGYGACNRPVSTQVKCPKCTNFLKTWDK